MPIATVAAFMDMLQEHSLIDNAKMPELRASLSRFPNAKSFAKELIRRNWLTSYQATQIFKGNVKTLTLGPYQLLDLLGEGGMGEVFKARHRHLNRIVALKILRKNLLENDRAVKRFQREVRAAALLSHPHIVRVFDADVIDSHYFFAMEYIPGSDLAKYTRKNGPLKVIQAIDYIRQAALGLQHAHEKGLIHRDIKPHNLLLTNLKESNLQSSSGVISLPHLGKWGHIKVLDMGLARLTCKESYDNQSTELTALNVVMGTPDYIAPEQARDSKNSDVRADIYSLGCTFYFLLSSRVPFASGTMTEKLLKHQLEDAEPIDEVRRKQQLRRGIPAKEIKRLSPKVCSAVQAMMAKNPDHRPQSPTEVVELLTSLLSVNDTPVKRRPRKTVPLSKPTGFQENSATHAEPEFIGTFSDLTNKDAPPNVLVGNYKKKNRVTAAIKMGLFGLLSLIIIGGLLWLYAEKPQGNEKEPFESAALEAWNEQRAGLLNSKNSHSSWKQITQFLQTYHGTRQAATVQKQSWQMASPLDPLNTPRISGKLPKAIKFVFRTGSKKNTMVSKVAVSPDCAHVFAFLEKPSKTFVWQTKEQNRKPQELAGASSSTASCFSIDGQTFVTGDSNGTIKIWKGNKWAESKSFQASDNGIVALRLSPDKTLLLVASEDGQVRRWTIDGIGQKRIVSATPGLGKTDISISKNCQVIVSANRSPKQVIVYRIYQPFDSEPQLEMQVLEGTTSLSHSVVSPDGTTILGTMGKDGDIHIYRWNSDKYVAAKTISAHEKRISDLAFFPDGKKFVSVSEDGIARIWDDESLKLDKEFDLGTPTTAVTVADDNRHILIGNHVGSLFLLRLENPS